MEHTQRLTVAIRPDAADRLTALAHVELCDPREQAALFQTRVLARRIRQTEFRQVPGHARAVLPSPGTVPTESAAP
jgi:hypothetical protein